MPAKKCCKLDMCVDVSIKTLEMSYDLDARDGGTLLLRSFVRTRALAFWSPTPAADRANYNLSLLHMEVVIKSAIGVADNDAMIN